MCEEHMLKIRVCRAHDWACFLINFQFYHDYDIGVGGKANILRNT